MSRKHHCLKTETEDFQAIQRGSKTFEFRKNDRDFQKHDILNLEETVDGKHTGRRLSSIEIVYMLHGGKYGIPEGYCIIQLNLWDLKRAIEAPCS